ELFRQRDTSVTLTNPDMPTLQPWVISAHPAAKGIELQRNHYYHRIDQAGRQLPYIGTILLEAMARAEIPARTAAGESDLQATGLTLSDAKLLAEAAKKGGPQLRLWPSGRGSPYAPYPHLHPQDTRL